MIKTVFVGMERTQEPTGNSVQIRTNSTDACRRWLLGGRERSQEAAMTAEFVLISSLCVSTMANNVPWRSRASPMGNVGSDDAVQGSRLSETCRFESCPNERKTTEMRSLALLIAFCCPVIATGQDNAASPPKANVLFLAVADLTAWVGAL